MSASTAAFESGSESTFESRMADGPVGPAPRFDPDAGWRLHHQVAVRPEPFGALLYHFGTRKLSFLKNRKIVEVVNALSDHPDARAALRAAGIDDDRQAPYVHALGVLVQSKMLVPKEGS